MSASETPPAKRRRQAHSQTPVYGQETNSQRSSRESSQANVHDDPKPDPINAFSALFERFKRLPRVLEAAKGASRGWQGRDMLENIVKLKVPQKHKDTVIAIIGVSGTGKSSLINALLGVDIAPVLTAGSCTTVATEFHKRPSNRALFTADVEYMTWEETEEDVTSMVRAIISQKQARQEIRETEGLDKSEKPETEYDYEADIARAKLAAMLPGTKIKELGSVLAQIKDLYDTMSEIRSPTEYISTDNAWEFKNEVKGLLKNPQSFCKGNNQNDGPQLWPLVKRVRIYMDSPLLRDGIILVDLPGSEDENAARSALAEKYIPIADEVIVAARYDKILTNAKVQQLLSTGLKQQVSLNGRKRLTVVCTATDALWEMKDSKLRGELEHYIPSSKQKFSELRQQQRFSQNPEEKHELEQCIKEASYTARDNDMPNLIKDRFTQIFDKEDIEVKLFMVSAKYVEDAMEEYGDLDKASKTDQYEKSRITQLSKFLSQLAIANRAKDGRAFLATFRREINIANIKLEAFNTNLSKEKLEALMEEIQYASLELEDVIRDIIRQTSKDLQRCVDVIKQHLDKIIAQSNRLAMYQHKRLITKVPFQRYKAICEREGDYIANSSKCSQAEFHLNRAFASVIRDNLRDREDWNVGFSSIKKTINTHDRQVKFAIHGFHAKLIDVFGKDSTQTIAIEKFNTSIAEKVSSHFQTCMGSVKAVRREITSILGDGHPIKVSLKNAYELAAKTRGDGATQGMKDIINNALLSTRAFEHMNNEAKKRFDSAVSDYAKFCEEELESIMEEVKKSAASWYMNQYNRVQGPGKELIKVIKDAVEKASEECEDIEEELNDLIQDLDVN